MEVTRNVNISVLFFLHLLPVSFLHLIPIDGQTSLTSKENGGKYDQRTLHVQVIPRSNEQNFLPTRNHNKGRRLSTQTHLIPTGGRPIFTNNRKANGVHLRNLYLIQTSDITGTQPTNNHKASTERATQDHVISIGDQKSNYFSQDSAFPKRNLEDSLIFKNGKENEERSNQDHVVAISERKSSLVNEIKNKLVTKEPGLLHNDGIYSPFSLNMENDPLTTTRKSFGTLMPPPITIQDTLDSLENTGHGCLMQACTVEDIQSPICACNFKTGKVVSFKHRCDLKKHNCKFSTDFKAIAESYCPWDIEVQERKDKPALDYSHPKYFN